MPLKSNDERWGSIAKSLHWIVALLVIGLCIVGWVMQELPNSPDKIKVYLLHKSTGLTVLGLMALRILWRLADPRPAPPPMPAWQRVAANTTHVLLYVILIAMPLSGWLFNSASNFPLKWFGLFSVPALSGPDKALKALAGNAHLFLFWSLAIVFTLHVAGALKHHYLDRDNVLTRMLPKRRKVDPPPDAPIA